jgi:hypothetical protein
MIENVRRKDEAHAAEVEAKDKAERAKLATHGCNHPPSPSSSFLPCTHPIVSRSCVVVVTDPAAPGFDLAKIFEAASSTSAAKHH